VMLLCVVLFFWPWEPLGCISRPEMVFRYQEFGKRFQTFTKVQNGCKKKERLPKPR